MLIQSMRNSIQKLNYLLYLSCKLMFDTTVFLNVMFSYIKRCRHIYYLRKSTIYRVFTFRLEYLVNKMAFTESRRLLNKTA